MTNQDEFNAALQRAEEALRKRRAAKTTVPTPAKRISPKINRTVTGRLVSSTADVTWIDEGGATPRKELVGDYEPVPTKSEPKPKRRTVNGEELATLNDLEQIDSKLRADFNEVLDDYDKKFSALKFDKPKPLSVDITQGDVTVGNIDGVTHYQLPTLLRLCAIKDARGNRMNILMKGDMGGGKSTAAKQVAEALGLSFGYIGQTLMPHDVMGYVHPITSEYHGTAFTKAFVEGGVVVLEEMDGWSPNATLVTNAALANGYVSLPNGVMHDRHPDCVIIACTNTWGTGPTAQYVGRNKLDEAFLDRFGAKIDWKYDYDLERAVAGNDEVVDIVQQARVNAKRAGLRVAISPRSSIDVAKMVAAGFRVREALDMNFLSGLDKNQCMTVLAGCDVPS